MKLPRALLLDDVRPGGLLPVRRVNAEQAVNLRGVVPPAPEPPGVDEAEVLAALRRARGLLGGGERHHGGHGRRPAEAGRGEEAQEENLKKEKREIFTSTVYTRIKRRCGVTLRSTVLYHQVNKNKIISLFD